MLPFLLGIEFAIGQCDISLEGPEGESKLRLVMFIMCRVQVFNIKFCVTNFYFYAAYRNKIQLLLIQ